MKKVSYILVLCIIVMAVLPFCVFAEDATPSRTDAVATARAAFMEAAPSTDLPEPDDENDWIASNVPIDVSAIDPNAYILQPIGSDDTRIFHVLFQPSLPEPQSAFSEFFGSDLSMLIETFNSQKDYLIFESKEGDLHASWGAGNGDFSLIKPSAIPLKYITEKTDMNDPWNAGLAKPSELEGKYTQGEALALVKDFLQNYINVDAKTLIVRSVECEDAKKARSRAYTFTLNYSVEGRIVFSNEAITASVTDEGLVSISGIALRPLQMQEMPETKILPVDEILKRNMLSDYPLGNPSLVYYFSMNSGTEYAIKPAWAIPMIHSSVEQIVQWLLFDAEDGRRAF